MAVASREQLKQYALRALGHPVVEVNVDDDQIEDRMDEALEYWRQYHPDGIEKIYMKFLISASELKLITNNAQSFSLGEKVTGTSSGATAFTVNETSRVSNGNMLLVFKISGTLSLEKPLLVLILALLPLLALQRALLVYTINDTLKSLT